MRSEYLGFRRELGKRRARRVSECLQKGGAHGERNDVGRRGDRKGAGARSAAHVRLAGTTKKGKTPRTGHMIIRGYILNEF